MWRWTEIDVTLHLDLTASSNKEWPMTFLSGRCPYCHSDQVVKRGKTRRGTQRYLCQNTACTPRSFLLEYSYQGRLPNRSIRRCCAPWPPMRSSWTLSKLGKLRPTRC